FAGRICLLSDETLRGAASRAYLIFMINKLLGILPNASAHGYMVDSLLEICHLFMALLFVGWTSFFLYTIWRFHHSRNPKANYHGVQSKAAAHLEFVVVLV